MTETEKQDEIIESIFAELERAKKKHPDDDWPDDEVTQVGIMIEEAGEAMRAALRIKFEQLDSGSLELELLQTAAMCVRILEKIT